MAADGERPRQGAGVEREQATLRERHRGERHRHRQPAAASTASRGPPLVQPPGGRGRGRASPRRPGWPARSPRRARRRSRCGRDGRRRARRAATASPRANVSRPTATLTTVPAANSRLAASARRPRPRTRSWKHQAATHAAGDGDGRRTERRAEHREQHPVPGRVVTGEPEVVPDHRPGRLDQLDPQQLRRPVGATPAEPDGGGGERPGEGDRDGSDPRRISRRPSWS